MAVRLTNPSDPRATGAPDARERLLGAAYDLFSRHGVNAVGIDMIIQRSGVARQTLYRHFESKQDLVLAFLQRRDQLWTRDWLQATVERSGGDPARRLLAIFDTFDLWFHEPGFEGCSFINVMLEHPDPDHPCTGRAPLTSRRFGGSSRSLRGMPASTTRTASRATGTC